MDTLQAILSDVRVFLYSGAQQLPLSIAGTMLLLGLFTANYAMLFFLVGFIVVVPAVNLLLWDPLLQWILPESIRTRSSDVCTVLAPLFHASTPTTTAYHISSQWTAMISFFFGYMIRNATKLLVRQPEPTGAVEVTEDQVKELDRKASYRKIQAIVSMISIVVIASALFVLRFQTGCESLVGFALSLIGFGTAGYFWYSMLSLVGQDRLSDLYGIANRLLPPAAIANGPVVCLPTSA